MPLSWRSSFAPFFLIREGESPAPSPKRARSASANEPVGLAGNPQSRAAWRVPDNAHSEVRRGKAVRSLGERADASDEPGVESAREMDARAVDESAEQLHALKQVEIADVGLAVAALAFAVAAAEYRPAFALPLLLGGLFI